MNCLRLCADVILKQFLDLVAHGGVLAAVVGAMQDIWVNWCTLKKSCIKYDSFELVESIVIFLELDIQASPLYLLLLPWFTFKSTSSQLFNSVS